MDSNPPDTCRNACISIGPPKSGRNTHITSIVPSKLGCFPLLRGLNLTPLSLFPATTNGAIHWGTLILRIKLVGNQRHTREISTFFSHDIGGDLRRILCTNMNKLRSELSSLYQTTTKNIFQKAVDSISHLREVLLER